MELIKQCRGHPATFSEPILLAMNELFCQRIADLDARHGRLTRWWGSARHHPTPFQTIEIGGRDHEEK